MSLKNVNTVLTTACALFVLYLGLSFILAPEASTQGVGLPTPVGNGDGFLIMKGTRELAMGLVIGILLVTGHRRALGWVLLMEAVAPFGDMINVLAHHGSTAAAFGIHGLTSALIAVTGLLTLRETGKPHRPLAARRA
ncbi:MULTISPECIES: DUF4267 domain-containing protein [unclassified Streptomyces]|uniref:DUF4267 domain-containing protein n=1 Tax=unclassified Streptomyces TaxID=2593676 RepID=UPI002ED57EC9|nr:DUF4267 domain-containing protein [Streptomyces sp. NBC_00891]WSY10118.1 DUF4267 domain-containing protein [Streptomyces sp. NBC_00890]WSZ11748.1 DUF4267 domain-containing protein [Streptomyces sp. NBC_00869]WSZ27846.1 DUF4267 domain-containing protein [Streptomyces sp. NBC_00870]